MPKDAWGRRGHTLFPNEPTSIDPEFIGEGEKAWYSVRLPKLGFDERGNPDANMREFLKELQRQKKYYEERRRLLEREGQRIE